MEASPVSASRHSSIIRQHRQQWHFHLRPRGYRKEDEQPADATVWYETSSIGTVSLQLSRYANNLFNADQNKLPACLAGASWLSNSAASSGRCVQPMSHGLEAFYACFIDTVTTVLPVYAFNYCAQQPSLSVLCCQ